MARWGRGFVIGDRATTLASHEPRWDGTIVDVIEHGGDINSQVVRVYWRYPLGRVETYRANELVLVI